MGFSDWLDDHDPNEKSNFNAWDKRPEGHDPTDPRLGLSGFIDQITGDNKTPTIGRVKTHAII